MASLAGFAYLVCGVFELDAGGGGSSTTRNWEGGAGNGNWNEAQNWREGETGTGGSGVPGDNDILIFDGNTQTSTTNNLGNLFDVTDLVFRNDGSSGKTASFFLNGDSIEIGASNGGGGTIGTAAVPTGPPITDTIALDIQLYASNFIGFEIHSNHDLRIAGNVIDSTSVSSTGLTKTGAGTLIFEGNNTYPGPTVVNEGTLLLNGAQTNEGGLTVASGATLGGDGTIGGISTISGTHTPGNDGVEAVGIQTFGDLTYSGSSSSVTWELIGNTTSDPGTNFDRINVGGDLNFSSSTTLTLDFASADGSAVDWKDPFWGHTIHEWQIWAVAGTTTGFPSLDGDKTTWHDATGTYSFQDAIDEGELPGSANFFLFQSGNGIYLRYEAMPELATHGLLGLMLTGLAVLVRPRRRLREK